MELINYALSAFAVSLGPACGIVIGMMAKEELKPGIKYFSFVQAAAVLLMTIYASYLEIAPYIPVMLAFLFIFRLHHTGIAKEPRASFYYLAYIIFAFVFFESSRSIAYIIFPALIFIFGLPAGSLLLLRKKMMRHAIIFPLVFFALSMLLIFSKTFLLA